MCIEGSTARSRVGFLLSRLVVRMHLFVVQYSPFDRFLADNVMCVSCGGHVEDQP